MKNTLENKLRFFATYYPQEIYFYDLANEFDVAVFAKNLGETFVGKTSFHSIVTIEREKLSESWLLLNSISAITKKIASEIQKEFPEEPFLDMMLMEIKSDASMMPPYLLDMLREKGFLLSFGDLSIEQLIEYGWAKLKES